MSYCYRINRRSCRYIIVALFATLFLLTSFSYAQNAIEITEPIADSAAIALADSVTASLIPAPATNIQAEDTPNDGGKTITVTWKKSPDDTSKGNITGYKVMRAEVTGGVPGVFEEVGDATTGTTEADDGNAIDGVEYVYMVVAENDIYDENSVLHNYTAKSAISSSVSSSAQWFDMRRINVLFATLLLCAFILYFIHQAKSGKPLFIRKIAGLEAIDEAVGRATEMGRKIFYVPGIGDMDNMMTIASITILGRVAELAAEYETYIDVPVCRSMVMVTGREVVKEAYSRAGRPDSYNDDQVHYLTDDQFGYAAGVDGMFVREKPATIFFMGQFYAESLILAETGNSIGAIQIAGTAMPSQLPFFVAACDYTLIGEELFAASAYLSKEPKLLGSLKGQDIGKACILIALIIGVLFETLGIWKFSTLFTVID